MGTGTGIIEFVEGALGAIERISSLGPKSGPRLAPRRTSESRRPRSAPPPSTTTRAAQANRPATFSIIEAIDSDTGQEVFLVRNGRGDVAICSSRAFAQQVRDALG